jgi:putative transposase
MKSLKSRLPTLWTNSYFVSTVGGAPLAIIKQYINAAQNMLILGLELPSSQELRHVA